MISDLASLPMQDTRIPLLHGIIPIITLLVLQVGLSIIQTRSERAREIIDGKATILIKNGELQVHNLKEQRFTVNEMLEELRMNGYYNIEDIQFATLETNGQISVIPKESLSPATKKDLSISTQEQSMPVVLISEGKVVNENLQLIKKDLAWLNAQLAEHKINSVENIFVALLDSNSKFFYQEYDSKETRI
jgi:uncharacterized membrane protein YcaP (DUF421 family)